MIGLCRLNMSFKSVNEIDKIDFNDGYINRMEVSNEQIVLELEGVKIEATNSQNDMRVKSYAGPLLLRLKDANIYEIFKEGYKYYDANNVLQEERPDEKIDEDLHGRIIKMCKDNYIFAFEPMMNSLKNAGHHEIDNPENVPYQYMLCVDIGEDSYWFKIAFVKAIAQWEKYLNKVQG